MGEVLSFPSFRSEEHASFSSLRLQHFLEQLNFFLKAEIFSIDLSPLIGRDDANLNKDAIVDEKVEQVENPEENNTGE